MDALRMEEMETFSQSEMRKREIVEAARELYEEKGLYRTSVKDITESVGVTRSLFYHYFENKDAVTRAVLDAIVDDFIQMLNTWNQERTPNDIEGALKNCVKIFRIGIFDKGSFRKELATSENAGLYLQFLTRAADALARYITDTTAVDYDREHGTPINHVYETFYILITGLAVFIRKHPETPDEVIEALIAQTLHLDLSRCVCHQVASD